MAKVEEEVELDLEKKDVVKYALIFFGIAILFPVVIGLPLMFVFKTTIYLEVIYIATGVIFILSALFRSRHRDSKNYKNNKSVFEPDKKTPEYKMFRATQWLLFGAGLAAFLLSYLSFVIGTIVYY